MIVGLPKEIKDNEYRVGLTPAGVRALTDAGHQVNVEKNAGEGSGFDDALYQKAGAQIIETAMQPGQVVFIDATAAIVQKIAALPFLSEKDFAYSPVKRAGYCTFFLQY